MKKIAIIGAGLSGLVLAREIKAHAHVTVFDKSRGLGGRMATRYQDAFSFDHGAQYFRAKKPEFEAFLQPFKDAGLVQDWHPTLVSLSPGCDPRPSSDTIGFYVAAPRMTALAKTLAEGFEVLTAQEIVTITRSDGGWNLATSSGTQFGPFDWVVSTAPAPQTKRLFPDTFHRYAELEATHMAGCFALLLGFTEPACLPWDAAKVDASPIGWISVNSSKPGRPDGYSLVVQTTNAWAEAQLEKPREWVERELISALSSLADIDGTQATYRSLHRWRFASTPTPAALPYLLDVDNYLAACGDWCIKGRVEAAYTSSSALAAALIPLVNANAET